MINVFEIDYAELHYLQGEIISKKFHRKYTCKSAVLCIIKVTLINPTYH